MPALEAPGSVDFNRDVKHVCHEENFNICSPHCRVVWVSRPVSVQIVKKLVM